MTTRTPELLRPFADPLTSCATQLYVPCTFNADVLHKVVVDQLVFLLHNSVATSFQSDAFFAARNVDSLMTSHQTSYFFHAPLRSSTSEAFPFACSVSLSKTAFKLLLVLLQFCFYRSGDVVPNKLPPLHLCGRHPSRTAHSDGDPLLPHLLSHQP